ncbi:polymorphic toxin-type HINT domain-containing protein [Gloeobacter violaceus]|uniref:Gll0211 protein n=1 Tax=Gloeobacter violaceus (strain ATCC 29082 / PCC 7421) TaxID=251221 RepID=Q7NP47_GLOVI|nr:polymorphic toxin-type HINT domain-containing protein [Gloeobacter violaceus]BAC88152.1 gll0211 [Gloeobacter violaceus PCC 7421]
MKATPSINTSGGVVGNPGSGVLSASASDTVLINGTNLNTLNSVTINGIAAYAVAVSATQIQVSLPENASTGPLVVKVAGVNLTASSSFKVNASTAPPSAHLDLVGVLGALQLLADVGGLIPGLNVPSAILGIGVAAALGDAAGALASGLALVPFGGVAKAGVGLLKAGTGLSRGIVAASRACGCFSEGTEVQTEAGAKPIELVEPGEKVLARNEQTGEQSLRRVKSTFQFDDRPVYRLELRETNGQGERDTLTVTGEHPFFLKDKGWTAAERLKSGERVQAADGKWLRVAGLEAQPHRQRTYNLEVEGDHTFFVGHNQAWVHNECPLFKLNTRVVEQLKDKRLGGLAGQLTEERLNRLINEPGARRFLDAGPINVSPFDKPNINVIQEVQGRLLRITVASDKFEIISVGPIRERNIINSIRSGRYVPF